MQKQSNNRLNHLSIRRGHLHSRCIKCWFTRGWQSFPSALLLLPKQAHQLQLTQSPTSCLTARWCESSAHRHIWFDCSVEFSPQNRLLGSFGTFRFQFSCRLREAATSFIGCLTAGSIVEPGCGPAKNNKANKFADEADTIVRQANAGKRNMCLGAVAEAVVKSSIDSAVKSEKTVKSSTDSVAEPKSGPMLIRLQCQVLWLVLFNHLTVKCVLQKQWHSCCWIDGMKVRHRCRWHHHHLHRTFI